MNKKFFTLLLLFAAAFAHAQKLKKEDKQLVSNLQKHIEFLADDKLEGRRTGSSGEATAAAYIANQFKAIGIAPKGTNEFMQPFDVNEGKQINPTTFLTIDGKNLELNKEYFPLIISPNVTVEALPSLALQEPNTPWFFDLKELLESNAGNPHFDLTESIIKSTKESAKRGATAIFLYNTSAKEDGLRFDGKEKLETVSIPVVYLTKDAVKKYLSDESATLDVKLKVDISDKKRSGRNVVGFLDNGAPTTIVIGAHFDHLGHGEDGGSREVEKKGQIHNGADDNASGTAAVIEMARLLKNSKLKNNNYLFIAFSGEELGLFGSKYFVEHPTIDLSSMNYMINMDMVGRLNDSSHVVTVGGYGTSPSWGQIYNLTGKKKLYANDLAFRFDSSGTGPSDHTSFYLKNIPVLFYFTGLHPDYHKPTDDYDKINYVGEMNVVKHIMSVIEAEDRQKTKLAFTKTRETQTTTSARFSVTMGIMPDYTFSGVGVRVDGVSDNKPAQKAGLKAGDVIVSIGDHKTNSMEAYMQTLGKFKKGDKTTVSYVRKGQTLSSSVEF
ncbi:MAG TPA: M20/M25/M40 family metallo-hydrolase [Flavisolibacter sp.]|nr:M20/M25/M40 family metallo-hydrolase [Flavisolibacter sp.]